MNMRLVLTLAVLPSLAIAAQKKFGSWHVDEMEGDEGLYAATMNSSKSVFGQFCYFESGDCIYITTADSDCNEDEVIPILVNSDLGAKSLEVMCRPYKSGGRYIFTDFDEINELAIGANRIGFAYPLDDGKFSVTRFDLDGSDKAIVYMRELAAERSKKPPKREGDAPRNTVL